MSDAAKGSNRALLDRLATALPVGRGSSGQVFRVFDPERGVDVALKVVPCLTPEWRARARREAELQARIDHPDIARLYGWDERDGEFNLVMQFVDGEPLDQACQHLPLETIAGVLARVARAVDVAHQHGLLHRDLKPDNIRVAREPDGQLHPYVLDFGLARDLECVSMTEHGALLGTPAYMSPEQARGEHSRLDASSDVYSLGVVAYAVLTGSPPLSGSSGAAVVLAVASGTAHTESPAWRQLPRGLRAIIRRCLEPNPRGRYRSAATLAEDLDRWRHGQRPHALRGDGWRMLRARVRRRPRLAVAAAMISLVALLLGWGALRERESAEAAALYAAAAADLETRVRIAHLLPEHSLEDLHREQRLRLQRLQQQSERLGRNARRHVLPALGRAQLALDDPAAALAYAESAAASGLASPALTLDRAHAHLRLYRIELLQALESLDATLAAARLDRARRLHAEPARQALHEVQQRLADAGPIVQALAHWLDGQPQAGLDLLLDLPTERVLDGALLRAELLGDLAQQALRGRADAQAEQWVARAVQEADTAVELLRSSPDAHRARCRARMLALRVELTSPSHVPSHAGACEALTRLLPTRAAAWASAIGEAALASNVERNRARDDLPALQHADALIAAALEAGINPAELAGARVQVLLSKVQRVADSGEDPAALFAEAQALLEHADRAGDPGFDQLATHHQLDMVIGFYGAPAERMAAAARAVATAERLAELSPDVPRLHNRLGSALDTLAFERLQAGLDPGDYAERALWHHQRSKALDPRGVVNLGNLGLTLWTSADVATWRGEDPAPWLQASVEASEAALAVDDSRRIAWNNLSSALTVWADWTLRQHGDAGELLQRARQTREHHVELGGGRTPMPCDLARIRLLEARAHDDDELLALAMAEARDGLGELPTQCAVVLAYAWAEALARGQHLDREQLIWLAARTEGQRSEELRLRLLLLDADVCELDCTGILPQCRPEPGQRARNAGCLVEHVDDSLSRYRHLRWRLPWP